MSTNLSDVPEGTADVYLTFAGSGSGLFDVDDFTFTKTGSGPIVGLGGLCLDVQGGDSTDGTQVQVHTCNGTPAQTWTRSGQTLRALGKCLDVEGVSTDNRAKIQLYHCNVTGAQNWVPQSDGSLVNPNSGKCLDVEGGRADSGTKVLLWTCLGGDNQKWVLTPYPTDDVAGSGPAACWRGQNRCGSPNEIGAGAWRRIEYTRQFGHRLRRGSCGHPPYGECLDASARNRGAPRCERAHARRSVAWPPSVRDSGRCGAGRPC